MNHKKELLRGLWVVTTLVLGLDQVSGVPAADLMRLAQFVQYSVLLLIV